MIYNSDYRIKIQNKIYFSDKINFEKLMNFYSGTSTFQTTSSSDFNFDVFYDRINNESSEVLILDTLDNSYETIITDQLDENQFTFDVFYDRINGESSEVLIIDTLDNSYETVITDLLNDSFVLNNVLIYDENTILPLEYSMSDNGGSEFTISDSL